MAPSFTAPGERLQYWLRVHMLHRRLALHERFLLHPRVLDVLEALIGPDVLALQSMLFFKQPGQPGQGYHQDSYYIPTFPDTLCGAWIAIDAAAVYWTEVTGQVRKVPKAGGSPTTVATIIGNDVAHANARQGNAENVRTTHSTPGARSVGATTDSSHAK